MADVETYLAPGEFIDSGDASVQAFARENVPDAADDLSRAVQLYYAVRDQIRYDPYFCGVARCYFRASDCLRAKRGFCIPKAALLAATARVLGIPAHVGYADVRNHLSTRRLLELIGTDLFIWHSYAELYLEGRWVKATPAFNLSLCERFGVRPLEFDGRQDSLFHEYDQGGRRHMEYVRERGHFPDVPYENIVAGFNELYPRWREMAATHTADAFTQPQVTRGPASTRR